MVIDLSNFYLNTPLKRPECIKVKLENFSEDVIEEYGLLAKGRLQAMDTHIAKS